MRAELLEHRLWHWEIEQNVSAHLEFLIFLYDSLNTIYSSGTDPLKPQETYVNIEYLTWPIIKYKREVLFGWVDLLVSFGGIAGLFLGFSLLSGVEVIYYFTLRAVCMVYKSRVSRATPILLRTMDGRLVTLRVFTAWISGNWRVEITQSSAAHRSIIEISAAIRIADGSENQRSHIWPPANDQRTHGR